MGRKFVMGDIHGAYKAMIQCFEKVNFNFNEDQLICLGDVCDGWPEVKQSFDELLKIKNLVYIRGNHDEWALQWMLTGASPDIWLFQGGDSTIKSYRNNVPLEHIEFLKKSKWYYKKENKLFIHGGFDPEKSLESQDPGSFIWDRSLIRKAMSEKMKDQNCNITGFDEVYTGHTPTINFGSERPIQACEIILMDTGAGWPGGKLAIMNMDTREFFLSDRVDRLYPKFKGRRG